MLPANVYNLIIFKTMYDLFFISDEVLHFEILKKQYVIHNSSLYAFSGSFALDVVFSVMQAVQISLSFDNCTDVCKR